MRLFSTLLLGLTTLAAAGLIAVSCAQGGSDTGFEEEGNGGFGGSEDLSPEERAISGLATANAGAKEIPDDDANAPSYADETTSSSGDNS